MNINDQMTFDLSTIDSTGLTYFSHRGEYIEKDGPEFTSNRPSRGSTNEVMESGEKSLARFFQIIRFGDTICLVYGRRVRR